VPQKDWEVNQPAQLTTVLNTLEGIQNAFNNAQSGGKRVSLADLIVLGGCAAIEQAAKHAGHEVTVPFTAGRMDASPEQTDVDAFAVLEPTADGFRNYLKTKYSIPAEKLLVNQATPPLAAHFPQRNRLIAGLSQGTLVVEAALQSGSLITARLAAEQGREVFAIPGSIHAPQSKGCHALIRQGAKLVESANDILEDLRLPTTGSLPFDAPASGPEDALLQALGHDPVSLDALQARTGLDTATLQARLLELELEGQVGRLPGGLLQRMGSA
jgi:hypothetical protein